ncbi:type 3 dihydrofolate reductase [Proteobacteria bacterium 005FR1]|nr:type 3 dihydrofolate reductase [Proteobacteria bacterium 005FR1]
MRISLIVALTDNRVIGRENKMPWHLPNDLKYFKRMTMGKPVVMGRKTFESIGKPLPGRTNVVITHQSGWRAEGVQVAHNVPEGLELATRLSLIDGSEEVMVIGGAQIYREVLPQAHRLYLTQIHTQIDGDAFFPEISEDEWQEVGREDHKADSANPHDHSFVVLDRVTSSEK